MTKHKVHHRKTHKHKESPYNMHFDRGNLTMPKKAFGRSETLKSAGAYFHMHHKHIHGKLSKLM